jgi:hypothetical protein
LIVQFYQIFLTFDARRTEDRIQQLQVSVQADVRRTNEHMQKIQNDVVAMQAPTLNDSVLKRPADFQPPVVSLSQSSRQEASPAGSTRGYSGATSVSTNSSRIQQDEPVIQSVTADVQSRQSVIDQYYRTTRMEVEQAVCSESTFTLNQQYGVADKSHPVLSHSMAGVDMLRSTPISNRSTCMPMCVPYDFIVVDESPIGSSQQQPLHPFVATPQAPQSSGRRKSVEPRSVHFGPEFPCSYQTQPSAVLANNSRNYLVAQFPTESHDSVRATTALQSSSSLLAPIPSATFANYMPPTVNQPVTCGTRKSVSLADVSPWGVFDESFVPPRGTVSVAAPGAQQNQIWPAISEWAIQLPPQVDPEEWLRAQQLAYAMLQAKAPAALQKSQTTVEGTSSVPNDLERLMDNVCSPSKRRHSHEPSTIQAKRPNIGGALCDDSIVNPLGVEGPVTSSSLEEIVRRAIKAEKMEESVHDASTDRQCGHGVRKHKSAHTVHADNAIGLSISLGWPENTAAVEDNAGSDRVTTQQNDNKTAVKSTSKQTGKTKAGNASCKEEKPSNLANAFSVIREALFSQSQCQDSSSSDGSSDSEIECSQNKLKKSGCGYNSSPPRKNPDKSAMKRPSPSTSPSVSVITIPSNVSIPKKFHLPVFTGKPDDDLGVFPDAF